MIWPHLFPARRRISRQGEEIWPSFHEPFHNMSPRVLKVDLIVGTSGSDIAADPKKKDLQYISLASLTPFSEDKSNDQYKINLTIPLYMSLLMQQHFFVYFYISFFRFFSWAYSDYYSCLVDTSSYEGASNQGQ